MLKTSRPLLFGLALLLGAPFAQADPAALYPPYLAATRLQLADYLPPPPAADSPIAQADLQAVLDAQAARNTAQVNKVRADDQWEDGVFPFAADLLGKGFAVERLPLTRAFFRRTQEDLVQVLMPAKQHFDRPRPYEADARIKPVLPPPEGDSYPSGHSMNAYLNATLLGMAVPEKRAELFDRAQEHAGSRVIAGVHYPSDLRGGQIAAAALVANLLSDPQAAADFALVRQEIRAAVEPTED
ncbi:phosphatase PAP2 family protein [Pseudomonas sp. BN417]|uniref:acid phosphatase n=1 Tax=Pseudomonas sp. BN417 TaxID=2567890 RepID=UPI00245723B8|nr:phosphatase PAP2 family protein [Pseudomonas sp. BN417]MDH4554306.1 phosphatase PAP2 family protein [Pseudomonas sp. BN417]